MNNFNSASEQFGDFSKAALDMATKFASVSFETTERTLALNLEAVKVGFDQSTQNAKALVAIKNIEDLNSLRTKSAETGLNFLTAYTKNLYELGTHTQAQYSALVEERFGSLQQSLVDNLDKLAKSSPAGTDVAINAIKSGLAASTAAFDTVSKAAKQMTAFADTTIKAAAESTPKAASKRK